MANDRLRAALHAAGLTIEDVSARLKVDPKTVERWIYNEARRPHRTTRAQLATLLRVDEVHLWPALAADARGVPSAETELVHLYPTRSAVPYDVWIAKIRGVTRNLDVLVFSGQFLVEQFDFLPVIRAKATEGVQFRIAVGDHTAPAVVQRAVEEGTSGGLEGRIQMMNRYLQTVAHLDGVEVRTHDTVLYNSLYRFDDDLFVNGHAYGSLAGQNPLWHLRRLPNGPMWEHYMKSFDRVWQLGQALRVEGVSTNGAGGLLR
jgi:transcriptional regulator with XRE-family HTH domain